MKLIFINGPYGYARDIKAMEIFRNAVDNAGWLDEKDSLVSGDMVGFNFGDDMISPLKYDYARSLHMSFFSRKTHSKGKIH